MTIMPLRVVGPPVAAAVVAATSAWWLSPALCHTSRPETTATYTSQKGNHVVRFQSVPERTSEFGKGIGGGGAEFWGARRRNKC